MDLLSQLRDIHYPNAISFWPPAIGWYISCGFFLFCVLLSFILYYWYRKKTQMRRLLLQKISQLKMSAGEKEASIFAELSVLLKRAALYAFPREEVASLYGKAWLEFLDKTSNNNNAFTQGTGKILAAAPYQQQHAYQKEEFFLLIEVWVKRNL